MARCRVDLPQKRGYVRGQQIEMFVSIYFGLISCVEQLKRNIWKGYCIVKFPIGKLSFSVGFFFHAYIRLNNLCFRGRSRCLESTVRFRIKQKGEPVKSCQKDD